LERKEFEKVITDLRTKGNPVYMDEIVSSHQEKSSLPPHSFAISFDDGFANNFHDGDEILICKKRPDTADHGYYYRVVDGKVKRHPKKAVNVMWIKRELGL